LIKESAMSAKAKYSPDPDLVDERGYDFGKEANDPGFDEVALAPGSAEELEDFESLSISKIKPEDVRNSAAFKARYAAFLKEKGVKL
jgi:hypothetical protein